MGRVDISKSFEIYKYFIPIIILIMALLNVLDIYNKIFNYFGLK